MNLGRRLRPALVAVALASAMALSACTTTTGGGDGAGEEQVLRFSSALFPVSLDTHQYPAEEPVQTAVQQVLEPLVEMRDGTPAGVLAE